MSDDIENDATRRRYLATGSALALTALAGCSGGDDDTETESTTEPSTTDETDATVATDAPDESSDLVETEERPVQGPIELLHGWSGGDGRRAFERLREGFEARFETELEVTAVGPSTNATLSMRVEQRVENDNPPGSWADWPGENLRQFTEDDVLADVEDAVWTDDVKNAYTDGAMDAATVDGAFVCVPTNIHRVNNLFYNETLVDAAGIDPNSLDSPSALLEAFQTVEAETDAIGFAHSLRGEWTTLQLFASIFIGQHGSSAYEAFVAGNGTQSQVEEALDAIVAYTDYMSEDAGSITFLGAGGKVTDGRAAFMHQGDWLAGMFEGDGYEFGTDWGHVAFPGTDGVYQLNMDAWVAPRGGPTPRGTKQWLRYLTTTDAQARFSREKGSIPPRTDVPTDEFTAFQTAQVEDYRNSESQPPSLAHGLAVPPETRSAVTDALAYEFDYTSGTVSATAAEMLTALED